jgi:hypothetical protein
MQIQAMVGRRPLKRDDIAHRVPRAAIGKRLDLRLNGGTTSNRNLPDSRYPTRTQRPPW